MSIVAELVQVLCGREGDAAVEPDLERATELLEAHPDLARRSVVAASVIGDEVALAALLDAEPEALSRRTGPRDWEPLLYAAFSHADRLLLPGRRDGIVRAVRLLLERGADPDTHYTAAGSDNGFSALYGTIAVSRDRVRTQALLEAGASPSDGRSALHAVEQLDPRLLEMLAASGLARADASRSLKHAIDVGWDWAVRFLLDHGADPDAPHPGSAETALHWAVKRGASDQVVAWLLEAGADPEARTRDGRASGLPLLGHTPLDLALRLGATGAADRLRAAGATEPPASPAERFLFAVARGDETAAHALFERNPDLLDDLPPEDRGLAAFWAQHGRRTAVALACALGFPLDGTAWMGLTPLHAAALRGDAELARLLVEAGAPSLDIGEPFGTPRHTAESCQWYQGDYAAVLGVLPTEPKGLSVELRPLNGPADR